MAYATLLHFMTQLSWCSLSTLEGAPFVWQVGFKFLVRYILQRLFVLLLMCVDLFLLFAGLDVQIFLGLAITFGRC